MSYSQFEHCNAKIQNILQTHVQTLFQQQQSILVKHVSLTNMANMAIMNALLLLDSVTALSQVIHSLLPHVPVMHSACTTCLIQMNFQKKYYFIVKK